MHKYTCKTCKCEFENIQLGRKYCSNKCRTDASKKHNTTYSCKICKDEFTSYNKGAKYCSPKCAGVGLINNTNIERHCNNCNSMFYIKGFEFRSGGGLYCCKKCYTEYQNKNSAKKINTDNCLICGIGIRITPYQRKVGKKYCSKTCYTQSITKLITCHCKRCNKEYISKSSHPRIYCSDKCQKLADKIQVTCHECNSMYFAFQSTIDRAALHFCSTKCKFKHQRLNPPQPRTGIIKNCEWCDAEFYAIPSNITHTCCSPKCGNLNKASKGIRGNKLYKTGYYISKLSGKSEFYASSYELIRMQQLDELGVTWTKRHKIAIPYRDDDNKQRHYIPDFLVGGINIEEVKPLKSIQTNYENAYTKIVAAKKFCKMNGYKFKIITEKELKIK